MKIKSQKILQSLFILLIVLVLIWHYRDYYREVSCEMFLKQWNLTFPVILVDLKILNGIRNGNCMVEYGQTVEIAVDVQDRPKFLTIYEKHPFKVTYFKTNSSRDYLEFLTDPKRIIPKNFKTRRVGDFLIANNIPQFLEFLRRSRFVDCLGLHIPRNESEPVVLDPVSSTATLAKLRDDLLDSGMFSFFNGGTFLGWYRECTVIPHTGDMDLNVFNEDFNMDYLKVLEKNDSRFKLTRKLGYMDDSFEISVSPRVGKFLQIDIFTVYREGDSSWFGAMTGDGAKYRFIQTPSYDPWCSADLHGHIFWTSCTPLQRAQIEFGPLFYLDTPTNKYSWYGAVRNGTWTKHEVENVFIWA